MHQVKVNLDDGPVQVRSLTHTFSLTCYYRLSGWCPYFYLYMRLFYNILTQRRWCSSCSVRKRPGASVYFTVPMPRCEWVHLHTSSHSIPPTPNLSVLECSEAWKIWTVSRVRWELVRLNLSRISWFVLHFSFQQVFINRDAKARPQLVEEEAGARPILLLYSNST